MTVTCTTPQKNKPGVGAPGNITSVIDCSNHDYDNDFLFDVQGHFSALSIINDSQIKWLIKQGIEPLALGNSSLTGDCLKIAYGSIADDGWFDPDKDGQPYICILVRDADLKPIDIAVWSPVSGKVGSFFGTAFALGEHEIDNPGNYAFESGLIIHKTPLDWLKADRVGICIIRQEWASTRLAYAARLVASDIKHGQTIERLIKPRMPGVYVANHQTSGVIA